MTSKTSKLGIPTVLTTLLDVPSGKAVLPTLSNLQPKSRAPFEIDEIHFTIRGPKLEDGASPSNYGGLIRVHFQLKNKSLTHGYVPIWNICPGYQDVLEQQLGSTSFIETDKVYGYSFFRWVLPRPIYIEPGGVLVPSFTRDSTLDALVTQLAAANGEMQVSITYAGRVLPVARSIDQQVLPYVAAWVPSNGAIQSGENDLRNVLDVPVRVQRLIGRVLAESSDSIYDDLSGRISSAATRAQNRLVDLRSMDGYQITNGRVPWCAVFPPQRRAWTFNWMMQPNEYFEVRLADAVAVQTYWPMVSVVGLREERI